MKDLPLAAGEKWPVAWVRCDLREQNEQQKVAFNRANHLPHLARLVISSQLRRRDEPISATRAARSLRAAPALSARREEPKEHLFAARGAEATRISLRWAADVLEELEKHGMLIWKGSRGVCFLASRGLRWGSAPASNGTKGVRHTPLHRKATQPAPGGGGGKCTRGRRKAPRWLGSSPSRRIPEQC